MIEKINGVNPVFGDNKSCISTGGYSGNPAAITKSRIFNPQTLPLKTYFQEPTHLIVKGESLLPPAQIE